MEITDRAMSNLSFALGLTENTDANTLMLNAAVRINRLQSEIDDIKQVQFPHRIEKITLEVRKKTAVECVEVASHQGSQFCIYCGLMLDAIKEKFGLEI